MALPKLFEQVVDHSDDKPAAAILPRSADQEPIPWQWTVDSYLRAAESGLFPPDAHLELIQGEIFVHMSPVGERHEAAVDMVYEELRRILSKQFAIRMQHSLFMPDESLPEPDLCVVNKRKDLYAGTRPQPADVRLIIEVSQTSLAYDRAKKAQVYGAAGIPEYWIVNLALDRLEVYRSPDPESGYREIILRKAGEKVSPLCAANSSINVADLIPARLGS
jgi:Uma2 family endonuclease